MFSPSTLSGNPPRRIVDINLQGIPSSVQTSVVTGGVSKSTYKILSDNTHRTITSDGDDLISPDWLLSGGPANLFEVKMTSASPSLVNGDLLDVWLLVDQDYEWWVEEISIGGVTQANMTIEVRDAVSLVVEDTRSFNLYSEVVELPIVDLSALGNTWITNAIIGTSPISTYLINSDMTHDINRISGVTPLLPNWLDQDLSSLLEVRATITSAGSLTGSDVDVWLNCGTDREWSFTSPGSPANQDNIQFTIEIRDSKYQVIKDSNTVAFNHNVESLINLQAIPSSINALTNSQPSKAEYLMVMDSTHYYLEQVDGTGTPSQVVSDWLLPGGDSNDYELQMIASGSPVDSNMGSGTWGDLNIVNTDRNVSLSKFQGDPNVSANITINIRDKATQTIQDSRSFSLNVNDL